MIIRKYWYDGSLYSLKHYEQDDLHRVDGPATTFFERNGDKISEFYYVYDNLHREDGPAAVYYDGQSEISVMYYLKNQQYTVERYRIYLIMTDRWAAFDKTYDS